MGGDETIGPYRRPAGDVEAVGPQSGTDMADTVVLTVAQRSPSGSGEPVTGQTSFPSGLQRRPGRPILGHPPPPPPTSCPPPPQRTSLDGNAAISGLNGP